MNSRYFILAAVLPLALLTAPSAVADEDLIREMAEIMLRLSHIPGAGEQRELREVIGAEKATAAERALAAAILNIKHQVGPDDRVRLREIIEDETVAREARELAGIILRFDHQSSAADRERLRQLAR